MRFIKLHRQEGDEFVVNVDSIQWMQISPNQTLRWDAAIDSHVYDPAPQIWLRENPREPVTVRETPDEILALIGGDMRPPAPVESQDALIKAYRALAEAVYNSPPYHSTNGETCLPNDTWNRIWDACMEINHLEDIERYD